MASLPPIDLPDGVTGKGAFDAQPAGDPDPARFDYLLRLGDDSLILGQRLSEWCGHAPALEVDLSLANLALDLVGQATLLLNEAGSCEGEGRDGDRLAFHRDVLDYRNCLLVEQPNGDFARTIARQLLFSTWQHMMLQRMTGSSDRFLAEYSAKAVKEVAYHRELASEWTIRLGDGTGESAGRMADGLDWCWRFIPELFEVDEALEGLIQRCIAPDPRQFEDEYRSALSAVLAEAKLQASADQRPILGGRRGHHSEHLGHILAAMQFLPRTYPDAEHLVGMDKHFYPLRVAEIVAETPEASSIRFDVPPELRETFAFRAGQHLTLKSDISGEEVRRNYSLCTAPDEQDWMVTVKRIAGGLFSNWIGDALKAGDTIDVMPPHGSFTTRFDPGARRHLVGIAGGSGITPVMSLLRTLLKSEPESRFTLLYGNRDSSSVIFLEKLAGVKDRYIDRFELFHFLAEEEGEIDLFNGMLDHARCDEAISLLVNSPGDVDGWFICGPGPMMDAAEASLVDRGIDKDGIHIERFTADRPPESLVKEMAELQSKAAGIVMNVTLDGRTRRVEFTQANILDSARVAGLPAPFACKAGVCATCRAKVTAGKVEMAARYGLTDDEIGQGYVLTCQSVPAGEGVAVDYDA